MVFDPCAKDSLVIVSSDFLFAIIGNTLSQEGGDIIWLYREDCRTDHIVIKGFQVARLFEHDVSCALNLLNRPCIVKAERFRDWTIALRKNVENLMETFRIDSIRELLGSFDIGDFQESIIVHAVRDSLLAQLMGEQVAMLFFMLFSKIGPVNQILYGGNTEKAFDFFANTWGARGIIAGINFLMWFGNTTILLMAGIMGIDQSLFEAASIDGATSWQVFYKITLPLLKPIMVYVAITSLIGGLQMFDVPQVIGTSLGSPNRSTMTMIMYLNNYLGTSKNYGMAGALSVIIFIITGILSVIVYKTMATDNSGKPKKAKKGA